MAVSKTTINAFSQSALVYEGYLTILAVDPANGANTIYTRLDQLMELTIDTDMETVTHFSSLKVQHNVLVGSNSRAIISIKDTTDMYQKNNPTNTFPYLLTDIIKQLNNNLRVVPINFIGIQKTESAANPDFIIENIQCDITAVRKRRNLDTGDYTVELEAIVNSRTVESADASPEP